MYETCSGPNARIGGLPLELGSFGSNQDDFSDFEEVPAIIMDDNNAVMLQYLGMEIELPRPPAGGTWSVCKDSEKNWVVTDGSRTKNVKALLRLKRARQLLVPNLDPKLNLKPEALSPYPSRRCAQAGGPRLKKC